MFRSRQNGKQAIKVAVFLAGTALFTYGPAIAQNATNESEYEDDILLEEIIVTAQKRSENLKDVPISIAVFNAESVEKTGVRQLREVAQFVPNVSISSGANFFSAVRVRGVGASSRNIGFDTRVGVYTDGVYMGQSQAQNQDLLDLSQVEVVRGPQGTQFGRNTVAGALNLTTNKPTDSFEMEVLGEVGNLESHRIGAIINLPIAENFAARFSVVDFHRDGFVENIATGSDVGEQDSTSVRGHLQYKGQGFTALLSGDYSRSESRVFSGDPLTDFTGTMPDPAAPEAFVISQDFNDAEEREIYGVSLTLEVPIWSHTLRSISAFRDNSAQFAFDVDRAALDIVSVTYPDSAEQFTQEIQLFSPDEGRLKYVIGAFFYDEDASTQRTGLFGQDIGAFLGLAAPALAPAAPLFAGTGVGQDAEVDTTSWAVFVNGTFDITERLKLGFGARYSEEEKDLNFDLFGDVVDLGGGVVIPTAALFGVAVGPVSNGQTRLNFTDSLKFDDFSPEISLSYDFSPAATVYAKYSESFKSGGFNVDFVSGALLADGIDFAPEQVEAWEAGIKGEVPSMGLRYSLVGFIMEFGNYQLNQFVQLSNNTSSITIRNAAEVTSQGIEFDLSWTPIRNLNVTAALGYTDAKFDSFVGGGSSRNPNGVGADLSGNSLPQAPEITTAVAVQYNHSLEGQIEGDLVTRLDWTYSDGFFTTEDNVTTTFPGSTIPWGLADSFHLLNGRIGYEGDTFSFYLWGRNLLNEEYDVGFGADFLGAAFRFQGLVRTYGLEARYRF